MPEAVIIDTVRTPIGRAFKGSLREVRPDDMGAYVLDQLLARNEAVDPASVQDVITGCGMTQGEEAFNIGRIMVLLSEKLPDIVTGSTIARYCASSLNSIWIAANAIKAGDGDTYIAAGVESASRVRTRRTRSRARRSRCAATRRQGPASASRTGPCRRA